MSTKSYNLRDNKVFQACTTREDGYWNMTGINIQELYISLVKLAHKVSVRAK